MLWVTASVIVYTYLVFPLIVLLRALIWKRPHSSNDITPTISLIIAAHNEVKSIGSKLDNILALDYPIDRMNVLIASDGSTDGTDDVVRAYETRGILLLSLPRRGKATAINEAVKTTRGDILVFSDANSMFAPDAIQALVRPFADPGVGGVAGDQRYVKDRGTGLTADPERSYWSFDRWLKKCEGCSGNVISATGAIYAIRRSLFQLVPDGVTDDFVTSTAVIAQGHRLVFAPDAIAYEPVARSSGAEFGRKVRVITRGLRGVVVMRRLLNPFRYGFYSLQLFSHKVLRRLVVFPLLLFVGFSIVSWRHGPLYQGATLVQILFYGLAIVGMLLGHTRLGTVKLFSMPFFFCMVNTAALVAAMNMLRGHQITIWEPHRLPVTVTEESPFPAHAQTARGGSC